MISKQKLGYLICHGLAKAPMLGKIEEEEEKEEKGKSVEKMDR